MTSANHNNEPITAVRASDQLPKLLGQSRIFRDEDPRDSRRIVSTGYPVHCKWLQNVSGGQRTPGEVVKLAESETGYTIAGADDESIGILPAALESGGVVEDDELSHVIVNGPAYGRYGSGNIALFSPVKADANGDLALAVYGTDPAETIVGIALEAINGAAVGTLFRVFVNGWPRMNL